MTEDKSVQLRKKSRIKSKLNRYSLNIFSSKGTQEKSRMLKLSSSRDQLNKGKEFDITRDTYFPGI